MPSSLVELLNLKLAWKRVKKDLAERSFIKLPNAISVIEIELDSWLHSIEESIESNTYHPQPAIICDIPKAGGALRPAAYLSPTDRLIYAACVGACYHHIYQSVYWKNDVVDFSTPLSFNPNKPDWIRTQFRLWRDFDESSIKEIEEGASHVVIADISGYYENIDITTLISDLKQTGAALEPINLLSACLNRWAQTPGRSIPQGYSSSDILSKLYLTPFDKHLSAIGYIHHRYVDDIRVFCRSRVEARKALMDLISLLRNRGLSIQTAKTGIYRAETARSLIEGVQPIIKRTANRFIDEIVNLTPFNDPYPTIFDAEDMLSSSPDDAPIEVIREAFKTYFIDSNEGKFDKTLFRFLLKRLRKQKDKFALEYCKTILRNYPEETRAVLNYFKAVGSVKDTEESIVSFLRSEDAIYPYQIFQIIELFSTADIAPSHGLVSAIRRFTFDASQPFYVHSIGREFLGNYGSSTDLELLELSYSRCSPNEQIEIICALRRVERGRRNAFLARAEHDGDMHRRAVKFVKITS